MTFPGTSSGTDPGAGSDTGADTERCAARSQLRGEAELGTALYVSVDVTDAAALREAVRQAEAHFGQPCDGAFHFVNGLVGFDEEIARDSDARNRVVLDRQVDDNKLSAGNLVFAVQGALTAHAGKPTERV